MKDFTERMESKYILECDEFCGDFIIEETGMEINATATEAKWHLADDGGVYCEQCWQNILDCQAEEDKNAKT